MYVEAVLEIDTAGRVVWEWYMSNHLCANCTDVTKVDINSGFGADKADWVHANSIVYDAGLNLLLLAAQLPVQGVTLHPHPVKARKSQMTMKRIDGAVVGNQN